MKYLILYFRFVALLLVAASLLLGMPPLQAATQVVVHTVSGKQHRGTLHRLTPSELKLEQSGSTVAISTKEVLSLEVFSDTRPGEANRTFVGLIDGSRIPIESVTVANRQATVDSALLGDGSQIPASQIAWIELQPLADEAREYVRNVLAEEPTDDIIVVQKGDPPRFDHLSGMLGDITSEAVRFVWDGEDISVKHSKLAAVAYYHPHERLPNTECVVKTRSGAELMAASVNYHHFASEAVEIVLACGLKLEIPLGELISADFSAGKIFYLSSMEPLRQQWTPLVGIPSAAELIQQHGLPRRNQSFAGSNISLAWPASEGRSPPEIRIYEKGLALRSRTTVEYRIPTGTASFRTYAGIDPQTADQGNVRLEIFADKAKLWAGEIDGHQPPEEISLKLSQARRLRIVVDYGKNLDYGDRLHLAEARLIKE